MKFEFTQEWAESVPLEEDLLDPSAGRLSYDPAELAEPATTAPATRRKPQPSRLARPTKVVVK
ncbi:hypothetical protein [Armatimonas sp.]|uniref:hypothetical protein n=1 Tax=Armatimonas sp. TaxID=1872638 RepID=UPI0037517E20